MQIKDQPATPISNTTNILQVPMYTICIAVLHVDPRNDPSIEHFLQNSLSSFKNLSQARHFLAIKINAMGRHSCIAVYGMYKIRDQVLHVNSVYGFAI